jgi:nucleoside-diphosphate-sugar epimerase
MSEIRRVAITGGSGSIGRRTVAALLEAGYEVVNLDRRPPEKPQDGVKFVYADMRERAHLQPVLETVDALCHLAELPHIGAGPTPQDVFAHNTAAASTVLQTAADLKLKRIIYTSSCQVYPAWGPEPERALPPPELPMTEANAPLAPLNAYGAAKVAAEEYARMLARRNPSLSIASFRFPAVHTLPIERLRGWYEHRSDAHELGTYLSVKDAAQAYVCGLRHPRPGFEAYHFVADDVFFKGDYAAALARQFPTLAIPGDWPAGRAVVSTAKAREHLGWSPSFRISEA